MKEAGGAAANIAQSHLLGEWVWSSFTCEYDIEIDAGIAHGIGQPFQDATPPDRIDEWGLCGHDGCAIFAHAVASRKERFGNEPAWSIGIIYFAAPMGQLTTRFEHVEHGVEPAITS
jgi:hypothetical protein